MTYLINSFGIQDSGGITVLDKLLSDLKDNTLYSYLIVCNRHENINLLIEKYKSYGNFEFFILKNISFLHRLYYENIFFRKLIKKRKIILVYNFSGSAQFFLSVPQLIKVHNLLFYSKKIEKVYFEKKKYLSWLKQIFSKKLVFHSMLNQTKYVEIQSNHVKDHISDYIEVNNKSFFVKSDINLEINNFSLIKEYNFSKRIRFLYIVGPHFEYLHKNFEDFVKAMVLLKKSDINFEINITLSKEESKKSTIWDKSLDADTKFLGYITKEELNKQFQDNTILISTSVIETLGLHVIESTQNGILTIVPNEVYSKSVYGNDILTYELFDVDSLVNKINQVTLLTNNDTKDIIIKNQQYLIENETKKYKNVVDIFDKILKGENV